jgi:hypothetical protein
MVIFLRGSTSLYTVEPVRGTLETLSWEVYTSREILTILGSFLLRSFASMGHTLTVLQFLRRFSKNCSMKGSREKWKLFTGVVIINFPKDGENLQQAMEHILHIHTSIYDELSGLPETVPLLKSLRVKDNIFRRSVVASYKFNREQAE